MTTFGSHFAESRNRNASNLPRELRGWEIAAMLYDPFATSDRGK
jgi:hypothetical protein